MGSESSQIISLKILVEEEKNQVVFAESNNDFVDGLFSFMTMPIGTIIRLTHEESLKWEMGCLKNLYESVENFDDEHLQRAKCKDMLLRPRCAAEIYCRNLNLDFVNNSNTIEYYACKKGCTLWPYQAALCHCGNAIDFKVKLENPIPVPESKGVFVNPTARFMITDDFQVMPLSITNGVALLKELGAVDGSTIKERCINIGKDEVMKMLKCSLTSMTPLSKTTLELPAKRTCFAIGCGKFSPRITYDSRRGKDNEHFRAIGATSKEAKIALKLIINKCNNRALYAEAEKDFVDLVCSFLTFPLGYVFQKFPSLPSMGCLGKLYKSIKDLDVNKYFKSEEMKAALIDPKLAPGIAYNKQLIPIKEALYPSWSTSLNLFSRKSFKCHKIKDSVLTSIGEGFVKGPFMVTDNLTITPLSPISGLSLINRSNISLSDIVEREVTMGEEEALLLLKAALLSSSALTDAFILKVPKQDP